MKAQTSLIAVFTDDKKTGDATKFPFDLQVDISLAAIRHFLEQEYPDY